MQKKSLLDAMVGGDGFANRNEADRAVSIVTSAIARLATGGERVNLRGFGQFEMRDRKGRIGQFQGREVEIPARRVLAFTDKRA